MDKYQPIVVLREPDRVRRRPAVIFGSDDRHLPDEEKASDEMLSGHMILLLKTECARGAT